MRRTSWTVIGLAVLCLAEVVCAKEVARFDGGDGNVAIQAAESADWQLLHLSDEIARKGRLRTSPVGVTQIHLPGGTLYLCQDSEADLDSEAKQIQLHRGKLRLVVGNGAKDHWRVSVGAHTVVCPAEAEMAVAATSELPEIHVLQGTVRVLENDQPVGSFTAPSTDVARKGNPTDVKVSADQSETWLRGIRSATEPRPTQGLGQLVARDAQSGSQVRLQVARYHVNVVLQAPVALVQIDQSFYNPYGGQQEGTFVFNLPSGASVSRFAMFVTHDKLIEGELIDRKRADEIYTSIVRSQRDPAILEQIGDNLFRMRVFPIPGRDTKRILLDYTVPLVADRGQYRFDLPLMSDLKPIWDFSLSGTIHPPLAAATAYSPTFPNLEFVQRPNGRITFQTSLKNVQPPPSFSVRYKASHESGLSVNAYTLPGFLCQTFVVTVPEHLNPAAAESMGPADVLLLVDTSGRTRDLSRARLAARTVVGGLRGDDRVRIGCADVTYRPLTGGWHPPNSPKIEAGLKELDEQFALGLSDLETTLRQLRNEFQESPSERRQVVIYVGDGPWNVNPAHRAAGAIEQPAADAKQPTIHAVRVGSGPTGRDWLVRQATATGGRLFDLDGQGETFGDLFEWSLSGLPPATRVDSIAIPDVEDQDLFYDVSWPRGRALQIYGRRSPQDSLQVVITAGGAVSKTFTLQTASSAGEESVFAGRLWARQKLRAMLAEEASSTTEGQSKIVQLCQEWSLMSRLTAFLVLETEQDYERWKVDRNLRHRYWTPAGSLPAIPLPREWRTPDVQAAAAAAPSMAEQVQREVTRLLDAAERAMKRDRPDEAMALLAAIRERAKGPETATYSDLRRRVQERMRPAMRLSELKLWRPVADRRVAELYPPSAPLLMQFAHRGFSPEFLENHPHARELLRTVPEIPDEMPLDEFARYIEMLTGVPVIVDRQALTDEGINTDTHLRLEDLKDISIRSLLELALDPIACRCVPERHLLRISTQTKADESMSTVVYPVGDLLQSEPMPAPHRLANPYLDRDEATRRRIESRLQKVVSFEFVDAPLELATKIVGREIGATIWIDKQALTDEGINTDTQVSLRLPNVPAEVALKELLEPLALTTVVEHEVLKVTTMTKADEKFDTRLYCTAGLMEESPRADRESKPNPGFNGMGMGGMAGMGGGMMGGGMGRIGGGALGGMGGMGGAAGSNFGGGAFGGGIAGFGGSNGGVPVQQTVSSPAPSRNTFESFDIAPAVTGEEESELSAQVAAREDELVNFMANHRSQTSQRLFVNLICNSSSGRWSHSDGNGGEIELFPLTQSVVVRQTAKVHHEMAETFARLRRQLVRPVTARPKKTLANEPERIDFIPLTRVIRDGTSAKWADQDGDGGSISSNVATSTLTIRQSANQHEQISKLLTQLRRARYAAASLPYRTSLEGIDDLSLLDRPSLTELPRNDPTAVRVATADEARWLATRQVPARLNQHWRSVSTATQQTREFSICRDQARLELILSDRTFRTDGSQAAAAYPGLSLVEIDCWSDAVRQLADASLPWLPHRSNEELAMLFEVTSIQEDDQTVTLRFCSPGSTDTYLQPTYSKTTHQPVRWRAVAGDQLQFELRFDSKTVVALDQGGKELERWELVSDDAPKAIPELNEGWGESLVIDASSPATAYIQARQALRIGDYAEAVRRLTEGLAERPNQPLLNFLLAWTSEFAARADAASAQLTRSALERVASSNSEALLRLMVSVNFPSQGAMGLTNILLSIPAERRSSDTWNQLAETGSHHPQVPAGASVCRAGSGELRRSGSSLAPATVSD